MDLTPDALRGMTFRGALRGYNVDDVDEFVEKVAVGMGELLEQLRLASERATTAERRAKEVASSEDAMRRTLGHAQKLAEAVLAEARQEAARVTEEAHQAATQLRASVKEEVAAERAAAESARHEAEQLLAEAKAGRAAVDAEVDGQRLSARAETEAERAAARAQLDAMLARAAQDIDADLQAEVARLHSVRQALQLDVAVLTSWMHDQRDSVRTVLVETLAAIDRAGSVSEPPPITEVDTTVRLAAPSVDLPPAEPGPEGVREAMAAPSTFPAPAEDRAPVPSGERPVTPAAAPQQESPVSFPDLSDEEFLAELKKAAAGGDDSPFGSSDQRWPP